MTLNFEGQTAFISIFVGVLFFLIGLINLENIIRWVTKLPHTESTGIRNPTLINRIISILGVGFMLIGLYLVFSPNSSQALPATATPTTTSTPVVPAAAGSPTTESNLIATLTPVPTMLTNTPIISPAPYTEFLFQKNCVPSGWKRLSEKNIYNEKGCLNIEKLGLVSQNNSIDFFIQPDNYDNIETILPGKSNYLSGIYMAVPKGVKTISFKIVINEFKRNPYDLDLQFFFGNFIATKNITKGQSFGDFILYRIATLGEQTAPIILFSSNPLFVGSPQVSTFTPGKAQNIEIIINELNYSVQIDGIIDKSLNYLAYPPNGLNFGFGYSMPPIGNLSVSILDFKIQ